MKEPSSSQSVTADDFDYSTPEAQRALENVTALVLEIRTEYAASVLRRNHLYERTLGLAVIPVLIRRAWIVAARRVMREIRRVR